MNRALILLKALQLLAVLLFLAGCSQQPKPTALQSASEAFDDLRIVVRDEIKDPAKAAEVAGIVDQMELLMKEAADARKAHDLRLRALIRNYDTPEEDFRSALREYNEKQVGRQTRLLAMDQRARGLTTEKEWKAINKARVRAFEASALAQQAM